jgi:hypothetical protein
MRLARADVYDPRSATPDAAYSQLDSLISEAETFHQLPVRKRIRIIACRDWSDFARFVPTIHGRVAGAVTYDTGTVIFVTPKIAERHFDLAEFLRHELSRQKSYVSDREFLDRAMKEDLVPVIDPAARAPSFDIRLGYVAWRYFLQYLIDTRGRAAFQRFLLADIHQPAGWAGLFSRSFGVVFRAAITAFQRDIRAGRWQLDRIEQARR